MIYVGAGLILGILAGLNFNVIYNPEYVVYISLAILAIVNTIFNLLYEDKTGELNLLKSIAYLLTDLIFAYVFGLRWENGWAFLFIWLQSLPSEIIYIKN